MIIGSANINDRSMIGDRDTEVCIYIEDERHNQIMDVLRELLKEHIGLTVEDSLLSQRSSKSRRTRWNIEKKEYLRKFLEDKAVDLSDDVFFEIIRSIAKRNSKIFREVFRIFPDNKITNYVKLEENEHKEKIELDDCSRKIKKYVRRIIGRFVLYPKNFLIEEEIKNDLISIQNMLPDVVYF